MFSFHYLLVPGAPHVYHDKDTTSRRQQQNNKNFFVCTKEMDVYIAGCRQKTLVTAPTEELWMWKMLSWIGKIASSGNTKGTHDHVCDQEGGERDQESETDRQEGGEAGQTIVDICFLRKSSHNARMKSRIFLREVGVQGDRIDVRDTFEMHQQSRWAMVTTIVYGSQPSCIFLWLFMEVVSAEKDLFNVM